MATFEELFPDQAQAPFAPIVPGRIQNELQDIGARTSALSSMRGQSSPADDPFMDTFNEMADQPFAPTPAGKTEWADFPKAVVSGIGDIGSAVAGGAEYVAGRFAGQGQTPGEQTALDLAQQFGSARREATQFAQDWSQSMSPEAQARAQREILTLDPERTLFQGGPREVLSAIGLKMARSLPSTGVTLLPGALMMRAGLGAGSIAYLGASEGGLSLGSIAANIAQEVEQAPEEELMQSERYALLRRSMDEQQARQQFIHEAQGWAPVVGGIVVGAISAAAGRYLEPVFTDVPSGMMGRALRGAASEGMQEAGQSSAEQMAQNYAAQVYDHDRSLGEGVAEQALQGGLIGGAMGGSTLAAVGPRRQTAPIQLQPSASPTEAPIASGATFESIFGEGGEQAPEPRFDSTGQGLLEVGAVDLDRQAALNARRDQLITDMFEQGQGQTPQEEQASYLQQPFPYQQQEMDLTGEKNLVPAPEPGQQDLPLRMRGRGVQPTQLPPGGTVAAPAGPDMSVPPAFSMERLPGREPVPEVTQQAKGKGREAIRQLRNQAAVQNPLAAEDAARAEMYRGMVRDETQTDMFDEPLGPDQPSAEPATDIRAQLQDLADPENPREAVYLSRDNVASLQRTGYFEEMRGTGVPLANFDGRGGVLIAKNRQVADELLALRDSEAASMQEILGLATGAGEGKRLGADIAVQQRDEKGNVVRESLVATPEEADMLASQFDEGPRQGVIISAAQAIKRRNQLIAREAEANTWRKRRDEIRSRGERALEEEFGNDMVATRGLKKIGRRTSSEEVAANNLTRYAARTRKRDLKKGLAGEAHPSTLQFADEKARADYERLFNELQGALINDNGEQVVSLRRQMAAHKRLNKPTTVPERILKAAQKAYPQGYQKVQREVMRRAQTVNARPQEPDASGVKGATRESLKEKTDTELGELFVEAAEHVAKRRGTKVDELAKSYPTRSEKSKLVLRVGRLLRMQEARSKIGGRRTKTLPITAKTTTQQAATGDAVTSRKKGRGRRPQRAGVFDINTVFDTELPREMDAEKLAAHKQRVTQAYTNLQDIVKKLEYSKTGAFVRQLALAARRKESLQLPIDPQYATAEQQRNLQEVIDTKVALKFARAYMRNLSRYGELLDQLHPQSVAGVREVERFNKVMEKLLSAKDVSFLTQLHDLATAEAQVQAEHASKVDPKKLGFLRNRKKRVAMAIKANQQLLDKVATLNRIHTKWKTNFLFTQHVEPVMHKLVGYMTRDDSFYNTAERRAASSLPTQQEMEQVRSVMKRFRGSATARQDLFEPLKKWFEGMGFKFDGQDLVVPDMSVEGSPLRYTREQYGYRYDVPAKERTAFADKQRMQRQLARRRQNERLRRAALTDKQRAREDMALQRKVERHIETERRKGLTFDQRKLLEALDRREPGFNFELLNPTTHMPMMERAVMSMSARLEAAPAGGAKLNDLLDDMLKYLPPGHTYQPLLQKLRGLDMDVAVQWARPQDGVKLGRYVALQSGSRYIKLQRDALAEIRDKGENPAPSFVHILLHEAVHAATVGELARNAPLRLAMTSIMRQARVAAAEQGVSLKYGANEFYGIRDNDVYEFVAEAFTNDLFQEALREIEISPKRSVWDHIVELVRKLLGLADTPEVSNVLELVLSTREAVFTGAVESTAGAKAVAKFNIDDVPSRKTAGDVFDRILQGNRVMRDIREKASDAKRALTADAPRGLLPAMTMEQIRDFYSNSFGGASGPLAHYMKAFFRRNAEVSTLMESADTLSRRWTSLNEKNAEDSLEMSRIMSEATQFGIHPDRGLRDEGNAHLQSEKQKAHHAELATRYKQLSEEHKQLYQDVRAYYKKTLDLETALVTLNAIRAGLGKDEDFPYTEADVKRLKLDTIDGLVNEFGERLTDEMRQTISRLANIPANFIGPYFPLSRYGDYVVTAEREVGKKDFSDSKAAHAYVREQRADDPTLSVHVEKLSDSHYVVRTIEREVRMAESRTEIDEKHAQLVEKYGAGNVSQPQLKAEVISSGAAIKTSRGLQTILNNLQGNPAAQNAIKEFYLRSMADNSFRKHEIKRQNRRGAEYDLQHRAFGTYAKSASYYTAQLRFGWQMADALAKMQTFSKDVANGEASSNLSSIDLSKVVREISARDRMMADQSEPSKLVRKGTALSQFMLLSSPSYWLINATQPYMVTLPWLAARYGTAESTAALTRAQSLIAHPIVAQMGASGAGLKALWSKTAAEKAFTVLEQVESYIRARGGDRAQEYLDMLSKLKRDSIIDLSFVSEIRDIAEGQDAGMTQKVLDASRIMSHLTEVNNRIMTAVATYDLARDRGLNVDAAQSAAHQAVSLTQFNYSAGNAPRLFSYRGPLGQMGPLVFQFMKYPQHIYALLIDNFRRLAADNQIERATARKTLLGLGATHMVAGGILGVMLQPIKWGVGLAMAAFGDDDEPYDIPKALSGETFDRLVREAMTELFGTDMGEILSAGLPRAAGIDLSDRMSLGTLYHLDLKTDSAESTIGSVVSGLGGPLFGLGASFARGVQYMQQGDFSKAIESVSPKGIKDALKAARYSSEGLTNSAGEEIMSASKLSPTQLFMQSMGFTPSTVSEHYAKAEAVRSTKDAAEERRKELLERYLRADAEYRPGIMAEIREHNRKKPASAVTMSQILKMAARRKERELRMQRYGVNLRGDDVSYADEGDVYNED